MEEYRYVGNDLHVEDIPVRQAAEQFGTPLYLYSKRSIVDHCRWIERALAGSDHLTCYAIKANGNRRILGLLAAEGIGADAGSLGELHLAFESGFPPDKVTFSGVGKRDDEIGFALQNHVHSFNVESEEELLAICAIASRLGTTARVLLRVNFDIPAGTHPYITTGSRQNKFGLPASRAKALCIRANTLPAIEFLGIHCHIGSQIIHSDAFIATAHAAVDFVATLRAEGHRLEYLNFGGGFGVQYHDYVAHPLLPKDGTGPEVGLTTINLLKEIMPTLSSSGCKIILQPGRSIVAHAGILLTKVLYRKENSGKMFLVVDAGMNDLLRPSLYQSYHQVVPLRLRDVPNEKVDIVGPLCESGDFLALDRSFPRVDRSDYLAVLCTGAYGYVLSSNYNARPRPAEVLVDGGGMELIRHAESLHDL